MDKGHLCGQVQFCPIKETTVVRWTMTQHDKHKSDYIQIVSVEANLRC